MSQEPTGRSLGKTVSLALGHLVTDLYPAFLPPLLPVLISKFHLSLTAASVLAMVLSFSTSMTQPLFGVLFDRFGISKWFFLGPIVAGLSMSLVGLAPQYSVVVALLILGGLGTASFHPEAAALAASVSGRRRTLGMSLFMFGGNLGFSLGPFLILLIVTQMGVSWSLLASLPAFGLTYLLLKQDLFSVNGQGPLSVNAALDNPISGRRVVMFIVLMSVVVLRVTTVLSLIAFLPMLQTLRGFSLIVAGSSNTVFMGCGALGGLAGGYLADRFGRRNVIIASFCLAIPSLVAFLYWKDPMGFVVLALSGFFFFLSEPSCIVLAQELIPQQARMASGLVMGMAWGLAGLGILGTGVLSDAHGVEGGVRFLLALPAGALVLSFFLPRALDKNLSRRPTE